MLELACCLERGMLRDASLMTIVRRGYLLVDRTQSARRRHDWQSVVENWILMRSGWLLRLTQLQLVLVFPCGQVACRFSQSRTNGTSINPRWVMSLPLRI